MTLEAEKIDLRTAKLQAEHAAALATAQQDARNALDRLAELESSLPEGVRIVPAYDRSDLINAAIDNLKNTLIEESIIVSIIIILFLLLA